MATRRYDYRTQFLEMSDEELTLQLKHYAEKHTRYFINNYPLELCHEQIRVVRYLERKLRLVDVNGEKI